MSIAQQINGRTSQWRTPTPPMPARLQQCVNSSIKRAFVPTVAALLISVCAAAQTDPRVGVTSNDPPGPVPDPSHVPIVLPKDIKCMGKEGVAQTCALFGDPNKAGLYGVIVKWWPGHFSKPHIHDQDRFAYVLSGTWWVSASNVYDERTTYPVHAGTVSIDIKSTVHWDGVRTGEKEPVVLELVGMGPVKTLQVDENGKPVSKP
jgi:quercetin dioxygenase-like cupin family protein